MLAQLMGHSDVKVTASLYAVFTDGELARHREMFSPLRKLGGVQNSDPIIDGGSARSEQK
jgi:hypothetical protein